MVTHTSVCDPEAENTEYEWSTCWLLSCHCYFYDIYWPTLCLDWYSEHCCDWLFITSDYRGLDVKGFCCFVILWDDLKGQFTQKAKWSQVKLHFIYSIPVQEVLFLLLKLCLYLTISPSQQGNFNTTLHFILTWCFKTLTGFFKHVEFLTNHLWDFFFFSFH